MGDELKLRRDGSAFGSRGDRGGDDCEARMGELERGEECVGRCDVAVVKSKLKMGSCGDVGCIVLNIFFKLYRMPQILHEKIQYACVHVEQYLGLPGVGRQ